MFARVTVHADDWAASERFYTTVLGVLGIAPTAHRAHDGMVVWDDFALVAAAAGEPPTRHLHVGFVAPSRGAVDAFWRAGVKGGYPDAGRPGEREYTEDYYGAFLLDPDGNSVEAVHHGDVRRGGHIDHLWIGVRDLDAADAFYRTIAPHTGLRATSGTHGRGFLGAWATFSLIDDGRPPTEHLHLAFPAPDRDTVDAFHAAALAAGYGDHGPPARHSQDGLGDYAASVLDPDGTHVESVFRDTATR